MTTSNLNRFMVLFGAICLLGQTGASAVSIPVEDDSMVNETSTPTDLTAHNYGRASSADIDGSSGNNRWSYFHFNDITADLPDGTTQNSVVRATLYLFVRDVVAAGSFKAYPVSASWLEGAQTGAAQSGSLSWSNKPANASTGINGDSAVGVTTDDEGEYIGIPVTDLVKSWISTPSGNHGIVLKPHGTGIQISFDSKENTDTSHPPILEVTLDPAAANPSLSAWFSGAGNPNQADGVAGDFYLKTSTSEYYVKTANGWGSPMAILGAQGPQGAQGLGYGGTSSTSLTVGTGVKAFTTQANLAYQQGSRIRLTRSGDNGTWMEGVYSIGSSNAEGADLVISVPSEVGFTEGELISVTVTGDNVPDGSQTFTWEYDSDSTTTESLSIDFSGLSNYDPEFFQRMASAMNSQLNAIGANVEPVLDERYGWYGIRLTTSETGSEASIYLIMSGGQWFGDASDQGSDGQTGPKITVDLTSGSGTYDSWVLSIAGERGPAGQNGQNGATWRSGSAAPAADLGNVGDYYVNTLTNQYYIKSSSGWGQAASLTVEQGSTGLGYGGTVTTSLTIGSGNQDFTMPTGLAYQSGSRIRLASVASPGDWMEGLYLGNTFREGQGAEALHFLDGELTEGELLSVTVSGQTVPNGSQTLTWEYDSDSMITQSLSIDISGLTHHDLEFYQRAATAMNAELNAIGASVEVVQNDEDGRFGVRWTTSETGDEANIYVQQTGGQWVGNPLSHPGNDGYTIASLNVDLTSGSGTHDSWTLSIAGEKGAPGVAGQQGPAGQNGATWRSGNVAPAADLGNVGDYYVNTLTNQYYIKSNTGWGQAASLTVEQGPTGLGYGGTVTTSMTIGSGNQEFTMPSGLAYQAGSRIRLASGLSPENWMEGLYFGTNIVGIEGAAMHVSVPDYVGFTEGELITITVTGNSVPNGSQTFTWEYDSDATTTEPLSIDFSGLSNYNEEFFQRAATALNAQLNAIGTSVEPLYDDANSRWGMRIATSETGSHVSLYVLLAGGQWSGDGTVYGSDGTPIASFSVDFTSGSGTFDNWALSIAGERGASGAPGITEASELAGTTLAPSITISSLSQVGTITGGIWNGTALADTYIASADAWNAKQNTLTFGAGLTNTSDTITIANGAITNAMLAGSIDLANKVTGALPAAYGGTGQTSALAAADALNAKGADVSSAVDGTANIGAATGVFVHVTGTETINSLGTASAGVRRWVYFTAAGTITHHATSLILPGSANITRAAGDSGMFESIGSGNWRCLAYHRANGKPVDERLRVLPQGDVTMSFTAGPTP